MAPSKPRAQPASVLPTSNMDPPQSLLWAYQLRREHGYLLSKIDAVTASNKGLNVDHKKLFLSNLELWASNREMSTSLKTLTEQNARFEDRLQAIEAAVRGVSDKVLDLKVAGSNAIETLDSLWEAVREGSAGHGLLKTSLDSVRDNCKMDKEERILDTEVLRDMAEELKSKVKELEREGRAKSSEDGKELPTVEAPLRQSQISTAAPTPMPPPQPKPRSEAQPPTRPAPPRLRKPRPAPYPTLPTQQLATYVNASSLFQPQPPTSHADILNGIRQGDLNLESYLRETEPKIERLKRSSQPGDAEERVVYAFLRGLEKSNMQGGIYMQLQGMNFAWSTLERIVRAEGGRKDSPPEKEVLPKATKENNRDRGYARQHNNTTDNEAADKILMQKRKRTRLWTEQRWPRETRNENEGLIAERKRRRDVLPEILGPDSGVQTRARTKRALTRPG